MKKNRLLAVGLAALMAVTAVTGCGGSAGTPAGEGDGGSSDGAKETITLRIGSGHSESNPWITALEDYFVKNDPDNFDGLNFLSNQNMSVVNDKAFQGTVLAHTQGGVPNVILELPQMDEFHLGYLIYFFEKACAMSGYMLGVNPFNQPGVESYKNNMFALLGKPGYEDKKAQLEAKLK